MSRIGAVIESNARSIVLEVTNQEVFDGHKESLKVGNFVKVSSGNNHFVLGLIEGIRATNRTTNQGAPNITFLIDLQPLGNIDSSNNFKRGSIDLPVPTEPAYIADEATLSVVFSSGSGFTFPLGTLQQNNDIPVYVNADKFFSKHIAVVGSTGSGKSCTVSKILQLATGIKDSANINKDNQKNSHIVIFDIHSEYKNAFSLAESESFNLNYLDFSNLMLPYWMMNSEELESMFIESNESNSHNQVSQFRYAVIKNKQKYNTEMNINYDTPAYFSIEEVCNYIENMNNEVICKISNDPGFGKPKLEDGTIVNERLDSYFDSVLNFIPASTKAAEKASNGPFHGEFNRFILRLRTKLQDERLTFILSSKDPEGNDLRSSQFEDIFKQFIGYLEKSNVTIIDLSGIPFEVLSLSVSLISRLIFDFSFNYSKMKHSSNELSDLPILLVCEEAHNYVPNKDNAMFQASKKSIERIAKEGRKYGLSLMMVSQRPSEVSETIMAQCNSFISLRLTNSNDQNYVKRLMPDTSSGITEILPKLGDGEFIIVGDAVLIPTIGKMNMPSPEPKSESVKYHQEWSKSWVEATFTNIITRWREQGE